jgi:hypothetical protein
MGKSAKADQSSYGSQTGPNAPTQQYLTQIQNAAKGAGAAGPGAAVQGAVGYNNNLQTAGNTGLAALSGDPTAVNKLMNPYLGDVVDATHASYARSGVRDINAVDANATSMGAFGGSRNAVAQGTAQAQNAVNENQTIAGLLGQGYSQAMGQAGQLAQGGAYGAGANANLGLQGADNPNLWMVNMLKNGFQGLPYGTSSSGNQNQFSGGVNASVGGLLGLGNIG